MSEVNAIWNLEQRNMNVKSSKKTNANKVNFSSYLGESCTMDDVFDKAAKKYNVSVNLLKAIGKTESNFNPNAVSKCGAQGVMQLMPATAAGLGVKDSFDVEQNIMGGAKLISDLLKKYNGDTKLALAAYNAGSGNVAKYGGIPPFKETQNYVVKVTNYMNQNFDTSVAVEPSRIPSQLNNGDSNQTMGIQTKATPVTIIQKPVSVENLAQSYDDIFAYTDYLKLLDYILEENKEKESDREKEAADNNYFASLQINYNIPVMNLKM